LNLETAIKDPDIYIKEVIEPFIHLIKRKDIKVTIRNDMGNKNIELITDWKIY
jgi:hypothetical protein